MEIKKINDLTYAFHFDTDIQMKTLRLVVLEKLLRVTAKLFSTKEA